MDSKFYNSFSLIRSVLLWLFAALMLTTVLSACSPTDILGSLLGGGPNVAANGQIGATNQQGINVTSEAPTVTLRPRSRVGTVDQSTTNNVSVPPWVLLTIVCLAAGGAIGWVDNIVRLIKRK